MHFGNNSGKYHLKVMKTKNIYIFYLLSLIKFKNESTFSSTFYFIVNSIKEPFKLNISTAFFLIVTINTKLFVVVDYFPCFHEIIMAFSIPMYHTLFCA